MDVGIKLWSHDALIRIKAVAEIADFVELMIVNKSDVDLLTNISANWTIHAKHDAFGLNLADKTLEKKNLDLINEAICAANKLNSNVIVVHCGHIANKNCSIDQIIHILNKLDDNRIHIENLCTVVYDSSYPVLPEHIANITDSTEAKFCFDFSHAQAISADWQINFTKLMQNFKKLNPQYFHVCDGNIGVAKDMHLNLGKGNFPINVFKSIIGQNPVALEVNHKSSITNFKKQIEVMKC